MLRSIAKPRSPARALNSMTPPTLGVKSGITDVAAVLSQYSAASGPASSLVTRRPDRHPAAASGLAGVFGNSRKLSAWLSCCTGALRAASNVTGSFSERQDSTSGSAANRVPTTHVALTDLTADVESAESASTFREAPRVVAPPASSPGEATAAVDTPGSGAATPGPSQPSMELVAHPAGGSGGVGCSVLPTAADAGAPAIYLRVDHDAIDIPGSGFTDCGAGPPAGQSEADVRLQVGVVQRIPPRVGAASGVGPWFRLLPST